MDPSSARPPAPPPPADFYDAASYHPNDSVGYLMRRILGSLAAAMDRELEPSGLTHAQWAPLFRLSLQPGITVAELARQNEHDTGAMTRLLDRLEAKGLCQRERSSEDRRVVRLALTEQGREVAEQVPQALSRVQNAYLAGFSREEWLLLKSFLSRILENAQTGCAGKKNP
jgi:DNA-binding MarR family transcriptional regulator